MWFAHLFITCSMFNTDTHTAADTGAHRRAIFQWTFFKNPPKRGRLSDFRIYNFYVSPIWIQDGHDSPARVPVSLCVCVGVCVWQQYTCAPQMHLRIERRMFQRKKKEKTWHMEKGSLGMAFRTAWTAGDLISITLPGNVVVNSKIYHRNEPIGTGCFIPFPFLPTVFFFFLYFDRGNQYRQRTTPTLQYELNFRKGTETAPFQQNSDRNEVIVSSFVASAIL